MPPVSARALPREQNERLRALLREIIAKDFDGGLTKAAERLGVAHATISDVLSGKRGVGQKLLSGLAEHTGRSLDDLVGRPAIVYDAGPVVRTLRHEVESILRGRSDEVGLESSSAPDWIPGFLRAVREETGGDFDWEPSELSRGARFRVHVVSLGVAGAGASNATDLWVPRLGDRYERRAVTLHELFHGVLCRRGEDRCEADVWMATAAWVVRAMLHPSGYGLILYPPWLVRAAPTVFWQGV